MKTTLFSLVMLSALSAAAAAPEEEQYGARIYFTEDNFEQGNYRDYFQQAFYGSLVRNREGRKGTFAQVTYGESRPFQVVPGKKYRLTFDAFNLGAKEMNAHKPSGPKAPFPARFAFLNDAWGVVRALGGRGTQIPGATVEAPPPAKWTARAFEFEVPPSATMFTFSISSAWKNNWGPYLISNIKLTELKEK